MSADTTASLTIGAFIGGIVLLISLFNYSQLYRYDDINGTTATGGLVFQSTIELSNYQTVGKGNSLFGSYDIVTRSLTHETFRVYK